MTLTARLVAAAVLASLLTALPGTASAEPTGTGPASTVTPRTAGTGAAERRGPDLAVRLRGLPGVESVREGDVPEGWRFFHIRFRQPADHQHPGRGHFTQRITCCTATPRAR